MNTNLRSLRAAALLAALLATVSGCGPSVAPTSKDAGAGRTGVSFDVVVSRQPGGTITTADGRINCGTAPTATLCGPVSFAWTETARLVATPDAGKMFGTWIGDCGYAGREQVNGEYVCLLNTVQYGADKFAGATFGEAGRTVHPNFTNPAVHGQAFLDWIARKPDTFECTYCHGASYDGMGIALSCTGCHAREGFPNWLSNCNFCHLAPPPPPPTGIHPRVSSDIRFCWGCHEGTVDENGQLIAGGKHMNGDIDATGGHVEGYVDPAAHGRDFFEFLTAAQPRRDELACSSCHGAAYDRRVASGRSCNTCHETVGGWASWQTNCSFCHGVSDATTKAAAYDVSLFPTRSSPPDAIAQRLGGGPAPDRTGAHTAHLTQGPYATAFACSICHEVPSTLAHISGREVRAAVVLTAPGGTGPDPLGYDAANGTCATRCHGAVGSPAWSSTGLACNGCHGIPPATSTHAGMTADLTVCAGCHPDTVDATGALKVSGGTHVNGTVNVVDGHADGFAAKTQHGVAFLDSAAGVPGALNCRSCHGPSLGLCANCHALPANGGWVAWETNCTFCHGAKTPTYGPESQTLASPPDAVSQRLTGSVTGTLTRTGKHRVHLNASQTSQDIPAVRCEACHDVPTTVQHVSAAPRRATVTFSAAEAFPNLTPDQLAALPTPFTTYASGNCTSYCHGAYMQGGTRSTYAWTTTAPAIGSSCDACHGQPPDSGAQKAANPEDLYCPDGCSLHVWHGLALPDLGYNGCSNCHTGSSPGNPGFLHVNGVSDVAFKDGIVGTWDPATKSCAMQCHSSPAPRSWR